MTNGARPSMQALLQRRKRAGFVGRRSELALFRENFDLPVEDDRHRFVFHVRGNAGVGKTTLVGELKDVAAGRGAVTAYVDEGLNSVPEVMAEIAACFARQGHPLKTLDRQLAAYRQRRHEAEVASTASAEGEEALGAAAPSASSTALAQAGLIGAGMIPVVGAFAGAVDPSRLAHGTDRLRAVLSARFRNQDDVQLVLDPVRALTPVMVADLERVAAEAPWLALFFDTYERTAPYLDAWLRDLITTERYGALPATTVFVVAGRDRLEPAYWADYADFVQDMPLDPFTEAEARQLLTAKGVVDEGVVQDVLRLSGGLPVLVSTLAEHPGEVGTPSATAVDRFLRWEPDAARRATALACALPRRLNEDVFTAASQEDPALLDWLRTLPFVADRDGHVQYHDVVRGPMLHLRRTRSPRRWTEDHERLAAAFATRAEAAGEGLPEDERWEHENWRAARLEESYHRLCAAPQTALPAMLRDGVDACDQGAATARRWARVLADAGEDADAEVLRRWGQDAVAALEHEREPLVTLLGLLLSRAGFGVEGQVTALVVRGKCRRVAEEYAAATADYERALGLDPDRARAHYGLALVRAEQGDLNEALEGLNRAHRLAPDGRRILVTRGDLYRRLDRYAEAVGDCDRALELGPEAADVLATRGHATFLLGDARGALADLDRAVEITPDYWWALLRRSDVRLALGDEAGALADLDTAEEVAPQLAWLPANRGYLHWKRGRHEEALAEFDRALRLEPGYAWALGSRALVLTDLGRLDDALESLERALAARPDYGWALLQKAMLHARLGDLDAQSAALDRAVETSDVYFVARALTERAELHGRARRHEQARADADRALELRPDDWHALTTRAQAHRALKRPERALADVERALEQTPRSPGVLAVREFVLREMRAGEEGRARCDALAAESLDSADSADPVDSPSSADSASSVDAWIRRASARVASGRLEEALADYDMALRLAPEHAWARERRARVRCLLGDGRGGLEDMDRLVAAGGSGDAALWARGYLLQVLGRSREALADLERCADAGSGWLTGRRAVALFHLGRHQEALDLLLALPPGDRRERLGAGTWALLRLGRLREAREAAEQVRESGHKEGLLLVAMAESRMRGIEAAGELWWAYERQLAFTVPDEPTVEELRLLVITQAALGRWDQAMRAWERMLGLPHFWADVVDLRNLLVELADCPGADTPRLDDLLGPVRERTAALTPAEDGAGRPTGPSSAP
ncbi:tetratricopeptide repeat protein [Streptomyces sp. NPDC046712]|uniref:tetratricopeptide repeat protein n=1 Tax=Streptomyces sp. NPDC046712 TaxID=3154802 RepID=UPI0033E5CB2B